MVALLLKERISSRVIFPVPSTMQTLVSLTDTSICRIVIHGRRAEAANSIFVTC
jgi:hypothetical protein